MQILMFIHTYIRTYDVLSCAGSCCIVVTVMAAVSLGRFSKCPLHAYRFSWIIFQLALRWFCYCFLLFFLDLFLVCWSTAVVHLPFAVYVRPSVCWLIDFCFDALIRWPLILSVHRTFKRRYLIQVHSTMCGAASTLLFQAPNTSFISCNVNEVC